MKNNENSLIKDQSFIIFGEDFARHPHALEHILRPLFLTNRFLWVETIGLRSPKINIYDGKRIIEKIFSWIGLKKKKLLKMSLPKNVVVIAPFMIPFNQFESVRKFNKWNVVRKCKKFLKQNEMYHLISIASVPNACDYVGAFQEKLKIYYCVDEFSLWPGLNKKLVKDLETQLIINVDMIIATSDFLSKSKIIKGIPTPIITHGVDFEHFKLQPRNRNHKQNDDSYKLCYFGLFDERSDQQILIDVARNVINCEIHIIGNIVCDVKKLKKISSIKFHENVNYLHLPSVITEMDAFILPYIKNDLTNNINPLKLKEYLSTGRPVIATNLPEVLKMKDFLFIGKNSEEFINITKKLQKDKRFFNPQKVLKYIEENETWQAKACTLSVLIKNQL